MVASFVNLEKKRLFKSVYISPAVLYFILLLLLHSAFVWQIIPMRNINHIHDYPISHGDYPYHYGQIYSNIEILEKYGQAWGYSTDFYAGYLTGITTTSSSKVWLFFVYLSKKLGIPMVASFNIFPIILIIIVPIMFYLSLKKFNVGDLDSILATFLMIIYFWSSEIFLLFIKWGLISFCFSMYLVFFCLSYLYHFVDKKDNNIFNAIALTVLISLSGWFHPLSAIPLFIGSTIILTAYIKKISLYKYFLLIVVLVLTVLAQLPWLSPLISIKAFPNASIGNQFASPQPFAAVGLSKLVKDLAGNSANAYFQRLLVFFSIFGLYYWWKRKQKVVVILFGFFPLALLLLAYGGKVVNFLEPMRFRPNGYVMLIIPASVGIMFIARLFLKGKISYLTRFVILVFMVIMIWPQIITIKKDHLRYYSLIHDPSPETKSIIKWLKENTKDDGRVLYENYYYENNNNIKTGQLNLSQAGYVSLASSREFIGGPFEWNGPLDFILGKISGIPIERISICEMLQFIEMYNIHWIVVYSNESKGFFKKYPRHFIRVGEVNYLDIYKVSLPSDYFIMGEGKITKEKGELILSEIEGNQIVIKYHWVPYLRSYPEVDIKREVIKNDPYGFIKISNAPKNVKIWAGK
ncbi:MAG: hypothetical protein ACFFKA_15625 [Candidatus Thorarchaeota archaeon]